MSRQAFAAILPARSSLRELLQLAFPVVVVQVGLMLMGVVDSIMVGRVSAAALAGVALGNVYFFVFAIFERRSSIASVGDSGVRTLRSPQTRLRSPRDSRLRPRASASAPSSPRGAVTTGAASIRPRTSD